MVMEFDYNQVLEHVQVNNIVLAAAGDGVVSGLDVTEKGTPDMSVDVAAGSCKIAGTEHTESGTVNLAISAADATHARKDLIIYDVATTNPLAVTGTPATPPVPPDITAGDILLAIVDVAANETTITNSEITDCIVEIAKLDDLAATSDNTNLDCSITAHGLLKKLPNDSAQYLNGVGAWATPAGAGDMTKTVYDPNDDGVIASAQLDTSIFLLDGTRIITGDVMLTDSNIESIQTLRPYDGNGISIVNSSNVGRLRIGETSTSFSALADANMGGNQIESLGNPIGAQDATTKAWVDAHNWAATDITSGTLAVARGGTGVTSTGSVAQVNSIMVNGCQTGTVNNAILKIWDTTAYGDVIVGYSAGIARLTYGTDGYVLTANGSGTAVAWEPAADLLFSDTNCPKCGREFQDGDDLILHVVGHNELGAMRTIPMHLSCANAPKKIVVVTRPVFEERYAIDETTGEIVTEYVKKKAKKTITRHKLKEGYVIDGHTGKAHTVDDKGTQGKALQHLADAIEEIEETIEEVVYEDVEFEL